MIRLGIFVDGATRVDVHDWWLNFLDSINDMFRFDQDTWDKAQVYALAKFGGTIVWVEEQKYVEFANDHDATLFLLRWS